MARYLTTAEVARVLGVSTASVRLYVKRGLLVRLAPGTFSEAAVKKFTKRRPRLGRPPKDPPA